MRRLRLTPRSQSKAKHHLSLSQRNIALSHLRSKNQLEELLERRIGAAEQLRGVLRGIDQAKGDVEVSRSINHVLLLSCCAIHPTRSPTGISRHLWLPIFIEAFCHVHHRIANLATLPVLFESPLFRESFCLEASFLIRLAKYVSIGPAS